MSTYDETSTYEASARPDAKVLETTFSELQVGDYITADGERWVKVIEIKTEGNAVSVLFEIPEPVNLQSHETRYWIDRKIDTPVIVDASVREPA